MKEKKKKGFKLPDTYVLVAIMLIVMAALTYIVPAGTYDMVTSGGGSQFVPLCAEDAHHDFAVPDGFLYRTE